MPKKTSRNTKGRIISAAWKLFYQQGYENTTVEDIVFESETSKGSFYHYFDGKDALLGTLADVFDQKYEQLMDTMPPSRTAVEKLAYLNHELFAMIEEGVSLDLLTRLNREKGTTIVMISSELVELRSICDRIAIIADGTLSQILSPDAPDADFGIAMSGRPAKGGGTSA